MSLLNDLGTSLGNMLKDIITRLTTLENNISSYSKNPFSLYQYKIGWRPDYYRAVVPLCEIDAAGTFSYSSGRFDFIRTNGCCSQLPLHIELKMKNANDGTNVYLEVIHNNLTSNIRPCKFTKNGQLYGGLEVFYNVQAHDIYFLGHTTLIDLYETKNVYWKYQDVRDNSVSDTEIYNSLVII